MSARSLRRRDRGRILGAATIPAFELLEIRQMMCLDPSSLTIGNVPDELPGYNPQSGVVVNGITPGNGEISPAVADPANIVWTNRGTGSGTGGDRFGNVFGANADAARAVMDQVILDFERMIGSFNYATSGQTYNLTVTMSTTSSLGASASLNSTLGGKPKSGAITMGGSSSWWIDPTPADSSEFQGTIVNAFSADAQSGSPAAGRSDFYTVAAAEMTHCLGLYGGTGAVPAWDALTTNTGIADNAEGGGVGNFWTFSGPSIQHLMTGNNGGPGGNVFNGGVHAAGPTTNGITVGGVQYIGAQDIGNAVYEQSRRYIPNETFALMFKDAYNFLSVNPATYGSMYTSLNQTTRQLLVRGGASNSADNITISRSGSTLTVSVDVGNDVAGTGALPGHGDLPAWVSTFDVSQVGSILIQAGDQNDTININSLGSGMPITVAGGNGNDTINIGADGSGIASDVNVALDAGDETVNVISTDPGANVVFSSSAIGANDTINVNTDGVGTASVLVSAAQLSVGNVNIGSGGSITVQAGGTRVSTIAGTLSISPGGKFDLNDNDLIVDYSAAGPSPFADVASLISTGRNGGLWNGAGIVSSMANSTNLTLGIAESSVINGASGGLFDNQFVDGSAVLVKFTYSGDTNLDGKVNIVDLGNLATKWQSAGAWSDGDLNYSGTVDIVDLGMLAANWQSGATTPLGGVANSDVISAGTHTVATNSFADPSKLAKTKRGESTNLAEQLI